MEAKCTEFPGMAWRGLIDYLRLWRAEPEERDLSVSNLQSPLIAVVTDY